MNAPSWVNILNRAVALGVVPAGLGHTVRFKIIHEPQCQASYVRDIFSGSYWCPDELEDYCDCTPWILWREVCEPSEQIHLIIDRSGSRNGLI